MPRILLATGLYPPDIGGPATYSVFLEKHLPAYGIALRVLPFGVVRKYPKIIRHVVYLIKLLREVRHVDYFYALDTVSVGLPVMLASFFTRTPYLLRVPGDYAWEQGQQRFGVTATLDEYLKATPKSFLVGILAWIQKKVAQHARRIIVPSDYMKRVVLQWGIDPEKIERIYSALKVIDVSSAQDELRAEFGYRGFVVVTAARLVPWKGVQAVIDALAEMRSAGIDASLEVIGDGTERRALEAHAAEVGIAEQVHFCGVLDRAELGRRIKAANAFVLNTSYEGLSHQLLEVMSIGVPIVTTPVGGNVELITHGETGIMVPFNDVLALTKALTQLHEDPEFGECLAANARAQVAHFHEDEVVKEFVQLVKTL